MTRGERMIQLIADAAAAMPAEFAAVDKKIRESKLGNSGSFFLSFILGALVAEFGAEETDRMMITIIAALGKQQKDLNGNG